MKLDPRPDAWRRRMYREAGIWTVAGEGAVAGAGAGAGLEPNKNRYILYLVRLI